ncbi:MAG: DUF1223 domain-containing protein [Micropepsaceae bacterium]
MTTSASLKHLRAGCLAALGVLLFWHGANAGEAKQSVLVELFTSQGCSSCPAADQILGEIKKRDDVVALSFSVDYWDYIGWRDTLAKHENTVRQQAYEKVLPSHRMYTPQIVIDGAQDMPGNQRQDVVDAIQRRASGQQGKRVAMALSQTGGTVEVRIGALVGAKPATVWIAHTLQSRTVNIGSGENFGRTITYHNVVRDFSAVGRWSGEAMTLELPARGAPGELTDGVTVWLQTGNPGPVLGAAQIKVTQK